LLLSPIYIIAKQNLAMKRGWEKAREREREKERELWKLCPWTEATGKSSAAWGREWESHTLVDTCCIFT